MKKLSMEVVNSNAAGIDIGSRFHLVAVNQNVLALADIVPTDRSPPIAVVLVFVRMVLRNSNHQQPAEIYKLKQI